MIYLASPYSHSDPNVRQWRFEQACKVAAMLMAEGYHVISPIAHSHPIAMHGRAPGDWAFWEAQDLDILSRCDSMTVAMLPGWENSIGVQAEIAVAQAKGIPITYMGGL